MSVVVDANLVAAILMPLPYSARAREKRALWSEAGEELVGPTLLEYEVCSTVRRLVFAGLISADKAPEILARMQRLAIRTVPPSTALHQAALTWAERLQRSRTYDAQYMALAEELRADLWTCDLPLFNRARQLGLSWVHCILSE